MSEWRGLYNHHQHSHQPDITEETGISSAHCWERTCAGHDCTESDPCQCCLREAIKRVREVIAKGQQDRGWGHDDDFDAGWDQCANLIFRALDGDK